MRQSDAAESSERVKMAHKRVDESASPRQVHKDAGFSLIFRVGNLPLSGRASRSFFYDADNTIDISFALSSSEMAQNMPGELLGEEDTLVTICPVRKETACAAPDPGSKRWLPDPFSR
jgi:hypothetical protein